MRKIQEEMKPEGILIGKYQQAKMRKGLMTLHLITRVTRSWHYIVGQIVLSSKGGKCKNMLIANWRGDSSV